MPALLPENSQPDIRNSNLSQKEPYHIPGYAGNKPQFKYQCSETFGQCTHRLLSSSEINQSGNTVLRPIVIPRSQTVPLGYHDIPKINIDACNVEKLLEERCLQSGDQLYKRNMRSGYMGFVPKAHFSSYHSKTFSENCNEALSHFQAEQIQLQKKRQQLRKILRSQQSDNLTNDERKIIGTANSLPLRSMRTSIPYFVSSKTYQQPESPYFLSNEHSMKNFKSGFAGHVPFYKDFGGHSFPKISNQALNQFTQERERHLTLSDKPILPTSLIEAKYANSAARLQQNKIFLVDSGIIPRYGGYVPGQKFRFGHTFGTATQNPLNFKNSVAVL